MAGSAHPIGRQFLPPSQFPTNIPTFPRHRADSLFIRERTGNFGKLELMIASITGKLLAVAMAWGSNSLRDLNREFA
jgi:hypothetical protein